MVFKGQLFSKITIVQKELLNPEMMDLIENYQSDELVWLR